MDVDEETRDTNVSFWEGVYNFVNALKFGSQSVKVEMLAEILESPQIPIMLNYYHDPQLSFEQYEQKALKYKVFASWFVGNIFYISCMDKFVQKQDALVDIQLKILHTLLMTKPDVYKEVMQEYYRVLTELNDNFKSKQIPVFVLEKFNDPEMKLDLLPITFDIQTPERRNVVKKRVLVVIRETVTETLCLFHWSEQMNTLFDCLVYVLKYDTVDLKLGALGVYGKFLGNSLVKPSGFPHFALDKIANVANLFENFLYMVCGMGCADWEDISSEVNEILKCFLSSAHVASDCKLKISKFLVVMLTDTKNKNVFHIDKEVRSLCSNIYFRNDNVHRFNVDNVQDSIKAGCLSTIPFLEEEIIKDFKKILLHIETHEVDVHVKSISELWNVLEEATKQKLHETNCKINCCLDETLRFVEKIVETVVNIKLKLQNIVISKPKHVTLRQTYFQDTEFIAALISLVNNHLKNCRAKLPYEEFVYIFTMVPVVCQSENVDTVFHVVGHELLPIFYKSNKDVPLSLTGACNKEEISTDLKLLYHNLAVVQETTRTSLRNICRLLDVLCSGLVDALNETSRCNMEGRFNKVFTDVIVKGNPENLSILAENVPNIIHFSKNVSTVRNILRCLLNSKEQTVLDSVHKILPKIICMLYSKYTRLTFYNDLDERDLSSEYVCVVCNLTEFSGKREMLAFLSQRHSAAVYDLYESDVTVFPSSELFKITWKLFQNGGNNIKANHVEMLSSLANHVLDFHSHEVSRDVANIAGNKNQDVRKALCKVIVRVLKFTQNNPTLSDEYLNKTLGIYFDELFVIAKRSLQHSDYELQDTLIETIDRITTLKIKSATLRSIKVLLYFIMIPTSKYSPIAIKLLFELGKKCDTSTNHLYTRHRRELGSEVFKLCAINHALMDYKLTTSLEKVSLVFGFLSARDFVVKETCHMLPYLVSLIVEMPGVFKLIDEMASLVRLDLDELLIRNYGNIFLYIFLNESDEVINKCTKYLEKTTKLGSAALQKRNFRTILNELLLNFHERPDRVYNGLRILAAEDSNVRPLSNEDISEYLEPQFLGVLQYFDIKLFATKKVLLSLPWLFKVMGTKITHYKFKIMAMLRTALGLKYEGYPELTCAAWDTFVRSCGVANLTEQLATIFVSLLPLYEQYPLKINSILRYFLMENKEIIKAHIPDLFFVLNFNVDPEISAVIEEHMANFENEPFEKQLEMFIGHLNHDTNDIKIFALKYLREVLHKNREHLSRMVLGYNGIHNLIVEVLDILMVNCRDKDPALKLACAEFLGELGAIEPSHLPRKHSLTQCFTFYITEDGFILNSLNELIKMYQTEKNTKVLDRYSLVIQETLKIHGISPDTSSPRHNLWQSFPETHRQLMLPFLSSKYTMGQSLESSNVSPVYGSKFGSTYQSWAYNWTCNLVLTIKPDKRNMLEVCMPSAKVNNRILLYFLPYIVLHSLLDGTDSDNDKLYGEFLAVISSTTNRKAVDHDLFVRPLRTPKAVVMSQTVTNEVHDHKRCLKVVFVLLDFLDRWVREWEWQSKGADRENKDFKKVKTFLAKFCKLQSAMCNVYCGEYSRSLMHLEDYIATNPSRSVEQLSFLAELYAHLDEPDAVSSVTALQNTEPTIEQRILALEATGKYMDAATCYESLPKPLKLHHLEGWINCYLNLDDVDTTLMLIEGTYNTLPEYKDKLLEIEIEAMWRLGQFYNLDTLLHKPELNTNNSWNVQIGRSLLCMKDGNRDEFQNIITKLRALEVNLLGATSLEEGIYQHGYEHISKLHTLNELEHIERMLREILIKPNDHTVCEFQIRSLSADWEHRIKVVQESMRIMEPILCMRRVALRQVKNVVTGKVPSALPLIDNLLGESWLFSARIARHAGAHQQAHTFTLKAEEYQPKKLFLEKAKLHWMREEHEQALETLKRGVEKILPKNSFDNAAIAALDMEKRFLCAEAKLLVATYNDNISNVDSDVNVMHYKEAVDMNKEWEKSLVFLAQYYDKMLQTFSDEEKDAKASEMQIHMINYFGKSLIYGTNYVYESMPRMLSIWFDYGTRLNEPSAAKVQEERRKNLLKMTRLIDSFLERLPTYIFLTAFSQIISRICHVEKQIYVELKSIIIKLILHYPQQTMWNMISIIKSDYPVRTKRCTEIFNDSRLRNPAMVKFIGDFTKLGEKLIELCNKEIDNTSTANISSLLRTLPRLLSKDDFSQIMVPTQRLRKLILPNPDFRESQHIPFPNNNVYIRGIKDEIVILNSLQKPRKITFQGSDGKDYVHMLKAKDDLRKDFRLMEFNDIVNQMLSREPESRQRRLNIRLYSVVPLNEECGLIEWVPNLIGLRIILMNIYKQRGQGMTPKELKSTCCNLRDPLAKKREIFEKKLLPRHPAVLGDWFRMTFPDAQSWFIARTAYIRTTAVISMVGYILGLGDRHGENILLDSTCGDTVHVDFNCLFNKGETFEWPERVPFRLTHNMVSAMGPLGIEGIFRKSCICTLKVLRTYSNTLMSIVTPFVYDPLVSWPKGNPSSSGQMSLERTNEKAVEYIRNIELRLQGMIKTRVRSFSIALSVEGQANNIIQEAINVDNLCQMYIGWGPYY